MEDVSVEVATYFALSTFLLSTFLLCTLYFLLSLPCSLRDKKVHDRAVLERLGGVERGAGIGGARGDVDSQLRGQLDGLEHERLALAGIGRNPRRPAAAHAGRGH